MSAPRQGVLHQYTSKLTAFEHTPNPTASPPQNLIILIGGLFDGLLTIPYTPTLASLLPPTWTLANVLLSSSYAQWGTFSLQSDVGELSKCVEYFRSIKSGRIVLMGHSTGCQDVMEYLTGPGYTERAPVDVGILQAPVSDREAIVAELPPNVYSDRCAYAQKMVDEGRGEEYLAPNWSSEIYGTVAPLTARRFLSLMSPNHDGDDDYFSSDLSDEQLTRSFGSLPKGSPLCILLSGADEYMPASINKEDLMERWITVAKQGTGSVDETHSGIVERATHNLKENDDVVKDLAKRVVGFANGLIEQTKL